MQDKVFFETGVENEDFEESLMVYMRTDPAIQREMQAYMVKMQMEAQPSTTRVHFEMASFVDETLLQDLTSLVIPHADSLGMNEQELPNLRSMLMFGNVSIVSNSNPRTAETLGTLFFILF